MSNLENRRAFLSMTGAAALLAACRKEQRVEGDPASGSSGAASPSSAPSGAPDKDEGKGADDVSATEDLMREHGVIRRVLVVWREAAARMRLKPTSVAPDVLQKSARLMRAFAEDYHEKQLEEAVIFPALAKVAGVATVVDVLIAQHQRGREITDYVLAVTQKTIGAQTAEPLARTLEGFARMYEEHAAMEDTIVFPAWKKTLSAKELDAMGDRFEDIEHKTFGKDGFDDAVEKIAAIEKSFGIDLSAMTPAPPPKA